VLATFAASSVGMTIPPPLDPATPRDLTTDANQTTPITIATHPTQQSTAKARPHRHHPC